LKSLAGRISRQLRTWADSLQNTDIKGHRYLDKKARRREKSARERQEFLKQLDEARKGSVSHAL
jgi:predicted Holliday junction resolvase-like endonuclease